MSDTSPIDLNFLATECTDLRQFDTKLSYLDGKGKGVRAVKYELLLKVEVCGWLLLYNADHCLFAFGPKMHPIQQIPWGKQKIIYKDTEMIWH